MSQADSAVLADVARSTEGIEREEIRYVAMDDDEEEERISLSGSSLSSLSSSSSSSSSSWFSDPAPSQFISNHFDSPAPSGDILADSGAGLGDGAAPVCEDVPKNGTENSHVCNGGDHVREDGDEYMAIDFGSEEGGTIDQVLPRQMVTTNPTPLVPKPQTINPGSSIEC